MSRSALGDNIHGGEILLPVRTGYIVLTLVVAVVLDLVPMPGWLAWVWPDFVAIALVYWGVFQPRRVGLLVAWVLGLLMDVADASLFGQHALAYCLLLYGAIFLHRRIQMFPLAYQVAHVAVMLLGQQLLQLLLRLAAGGDFPGITYFASSLTAAALWPVLVALLRLPLRRRSDSDVP
ncbi:MAG: rod shape-determining protein MreD [Burkholderiales bacterium]|nr:rod shape-determining protein MreD [Burkholderiales bacterium]